MKRYGFVLLLIGVLFASCEKNMVSKIPHIALVEFMPTDSMKVNSDSAYFFFSFTDGNADIGNDTVSKIYMIDIRKDTIVYYSYPFPQIDGSVEDPKKGLSGKCFFVPDPGPLPRPDAVHQANGDTLHYEFYIKDREGNESNHIVTHDFIIRN
jgi:hypothetical protein